MPKSLKYGSPIHRAESTVVVGPTPRYCTDFQFHCLYEVRGRPFRQILLLNYGASNNAPVNIFDVNLFIEHPHLSWGKGRRQLNGMATTYAPQTTSGTTTTFLPRITPFTGPAICSDWTHNLATYDSELSSTYLYAWDPLYGLYINESVTCQPAEATTWAVGLSSRASLSSASSDLGDSVTILAPFSCPGNWTAAWSSTENPSTSATVCCPS
jgi:hypothetical protein